MPKSMMAPPEVARPGPPPRNKKPKVGKSPNTTESNGVAGGAHPPPGRAKGGRSLGPTTPTNGTTLPTKSKAGSSRASKPSPRRKASSAGEVSKSSAPNLAELEAQIKENHDQFFDSYRSSLRHALRVGQLLLQVKEHLGHGPFTGWVESRCPFSVESARAYMRVARNGAIVEEGSKRQFATGLTLTDVLKRLAKPRAKKTASEGGGADTSTNSARPEPDAPAQVDAGGPDEDAGEATADAAATEGTGAGAVAGDGTDRAEARREAADENAGRRRDEDGADGRRAGRADHRTRDNGNGRATREAESATAEDSSAPAGEDRLDDRQWLASLPVRQKLGDSRRSLIEDGAPLATPSTRDRRGWTRADGRPGWLGCPQFHGRVHATGCRFPSRVAELLIRRYASRGHAGSPAGVAWQRARQERGVGRIPAPWCEGAGYRVTIWRVRRRFACRAAGLEAVVGRDDFMDDRARHVSCPNDSQIGAGPGSRRYEQLRGSIEGTALPWARR